MILTRKNHRSGDQFYLELLVKYAELDKYNDIKIVPISNEHAKLMNAEILPRMLTKDGRSLISLQEISSELLTEVNFDTALIGNTLESKSNSFRFFELCHQHQGNHEALCEVLQKELNGVTFLNGEPNLHISDLFVFCQIIDFMANSAPEIKAKFYNVYRWFNYIQNLNGIQETIAELKHRPMDSLTLDDISGSVSTGKNKGKKPENPVQGENQKGGQQKPQQANPNQKPQQQNKQQAKPAQNAETKKTDSAPVQ
jgi:hypothetical protein